MSESPEGDYIGGVPMKVFDYDIGEHVVMLKSGIKAIVTLYENQFKIEAENYKGKRIFFNVEIEAYTRPDVLKLDVQSLIYGSRELDDIGSADIKLLVEQAIVYIEKHSRSKERVSWIQDTITLNTRNEFNIMLYHLQNEKSLEESIRIAAQRYIGGRVANHCGFKFHYYEMDGQKIKLRYRRG
jgi:hypothetical protein